MLERYARETYDAAREPACEARANDIVKTLLVRGSSMGTHSPWRCGGVIAYEDVVVDVVVVVLDSEQRGGEMEKGREREIGFVYPALSVFGRLGLILRGRSQSDLAYMVIPLH